MADGGPQESVLEMIANERNWRSSGSKTQTNKPPETNINAKPEKTKPKKNTTDIIIPLDDSDDDKNSNENEDEKSSEEDDDGPIFYGRVAPPPANAHRANNPLYQQSQDSSAQMLPTPLPSSPVNVVNQSEKRTSVNSFRNRNNSDSENNNTQGSFRFNREDSGVPPVSLMTNLDEDDGRKKKKRKCKCNASCIFCWRLPIVKWRATPIILLLLAIAVTGIVFYFVMDSREIYKVKVYYWTLWLALLVVSLIVLDFIVQFGTTVFKGFFLFTRAYYFINSRGLQYTFLVWSGVHLGVWRGLFKGETDEDVFKYVERALISILVVSVCRCGLVVLDKFAISYLQQKQFWDSIQDLMFKERALATLIDSPKRRKLAGASDRSSTNDFRKAWKRLKQSYANEKINNSNAREKTFQEAVEVATQIVNNLDVDNKGYLVRKDFMPFFKKKEEISTVLDFFDKDKNDTITLDEVIKTVYEIFKNRKALFDTINDRQNVAKIVKNILGSLFWILMFIVVLLIFGVDIKSFLLPLSTFILALSFVFGNSLKSVWEAVILVFVIQPFEVGDRFTIPNYPTLVVNKIELFTTTAFATDGPQYIIPNSVLYSSVIKQLKRSKDYAVSITFNIGFNTTKSQIESLRSRIDQWLHNDTQAPWKASEALFWVSDIFDSNKIVCNLWVELRDVNWSRPSLYLVPKSNLLLAIQEICRELNIEYKLPKQEISFKKIL